MSKPNLTVFVHFHFQSVGIVNVITKMITLPGYIEADSVLAQREVMSLYEGKWLEPVYHVILKWTP